MRILMALDYYRPNVSGLSLYVERLGRALAERGHAVTVLTHRHAPGLPLVETDGGVRVVRAPVAARVGKALLSPALILRAARELASADVLHLHAPLVPAFPLALAAVARQVPVVVTYTEDYARHVESLAERPETVRWILPPVPDPLPTGLSREEARAKYGVRGSPVILFLGRFAEEKGLPHLISAFPIVRAVFPSAALVLAGEKDSVPGETVGERLAPLLADSESGIVATGLVAPEKTPELLSLADVLVLPSTNSTESFGLCQVEAMLSGVPCVASDLPGVRQPVRMTGMGEIASVGDASSLARALVAVLSDPERYRRPHEVVRSAFEMARTVAEYERIYSESSAA